MTTGATGLARCKTLVYHPPESSGTTKGNPMTTDKKKYPAAIQALLDVLAADSAAVAAKAAADGVASEVSGDDVEQAHILAEIAAGLIPKPVKATADEKALAKAIATVNSLALAIGDRRCKRIPQPASILGYKLLGSSSLTQEAEIVTKALGTMTQAHRNLGMDLVSELKLSTCVMSKHNRLTKSGVKGAKPAAKAWRALTGAACAAGILTAEQVLKLGIALDPAKVAKAA